MRKDRLDLFKIHRNIAALTISFSMVFSLISLPAYSKAEEHVDSYDYQSEAGIMEVQSTEVSRFAVLQGHLNQILEDSDDEDDTNNISVDDREWNIYKSTYTYDQMDSDEKKLYDALDSVCSEFIEDSSKDATYITDKKGEGSYYLSAVSVKDLYDYVHPNSSKFIDVVQMFIYANPQYYFTTASYALSGTDLYLYCYPAFADGEERAVVTNAMFSRVDTWVENITKDNKTREEIEKSAHDFICAKLSYDNDAAEKMNAGDYSGNVYYSQSIYSAINKYKTVCAGYSLTFELLLNASGVPVVTAYSDYHAWNKVNLSDNKWYAVDVTWDDGGDASKINYTFYNKSDDSITVYDDDLPVHQAKTSKYYPVAESDYVAKEKTDDSEIESDDKSEEKIFDTEVILKNKDDSDEVIEDGNKTTDDVTKDSDKRTDDVIEDSDKRTDDVTEDSDKRTDDVIEDSDKRTNDVIEDSDKRTNDVIEDSDKTTNEVIEEGSKATDKVIEDGNKTTDAVIEGNNAISDGANKDSTKSQDYSNKSSETVINNNANAKVQPVKEDSISSSIVIRNDQNSNLDLATTHKTKITKIKSGQKKIKVSWSKVEDVTGYEIQLSTSKNFKKVAKKVKVSKSSTNTWIKKVKKRTTYYVRIRTIMNVNGEDLMSDWSGVKKVTVK